KREPLIDIFQRVAGNNREAWDIVEDLADTAEIIDEVCEEGPYGVLDDLEKLNLMPDDIPKLYRCCQSNIMILNALIFLGYKGVITAKGLRETIDNDFKGFYSPEQIVGIVRRFQPGFGEAYKPGSRLG